MSRIRINLLTAVALCALLFACARQAAATPTVITDRSGLGSNTATLDFEGATTNTSAGLPASLTFLGVTFAGDSRRNNAGVEVVAPTGNLGTNTNTLFATGDNFAQSATSPIFNLMISLPTGTTTVGFDIANSNNGAAVYDIYVNGAFFQSVATTFGSFSFVGFSDLTGINSIGIARSLASLSGDPVLDNFTFGPAAAPTETPEPATLALLGTGLAGLAAFARRRRARRLAAGASLA
ncbi:MAG TPA: PEP-CTERM sorting domain-containing protein [Pyrinomonadaceae bacterium]|jgi:hypothetical protein